jgi:hypothetical protein
MNLALNSFQLSSISIIVSFGVSNVNILIKVLTRNPSIDEHFRSTPNEERSEYSQEHCQVSLLLRLYNQNS